MPHSCAMRQRGVPGDLPYRVGSSGRAIDDIPAGGCAVVDVGSVYAGAEITAVTPEAAAEGVVAAIAGESIVSRAAGDGVAALAPADHDPLGEPAGVDDVVSSVAFDVVERAGNSATSSPGLRQQPDGNLDGTDANPEGSRGPTSGETGGGRGLPALLALDATTVDADDEELPFNIAALALKRDFFARYRAYMERAYMAHETPHDVGSGGYSATPSSLRAGTTCRRAGDTCPSARSCSTRSGGRRSNRQGRPSSGRRPSQRNMPSSRTSRRTDRGSRAGTPAGGSLMVGNGRYRHVAVALWPSRVRREVRISVDRENSFVTAVRLRRRDGHDERRR